MHALACCWFLSAAAAAQMPSHDEAIQVVTALETAVADAIEKAQPSIVSITRIRSATGETMAIRGKTAPREAAAAALGAADRPGFPNAGSPNDPANISPDVFPLPGDFGGGVVIGTQGQILTTYHIVIGAERLRVRGQGAVFDAEIIAADPRSDLAVIVPVAASGVEISLKPMTIGDADKLRRGSFLIALGNPYNAARDGKASASLGILSNIGRKFDPPVDTDINIRRLFKYQPTLMQLDTRLNLGMSGGAIVNMKGELVGISTAGASPVGYDAAAGYAIPLDALGRRAVGELVQGKEVEYSFIGIGLALEPNTVSLVEHGSPAMQANLATGDKILAVGEKVLAEDESALPLALASVPVGEPVKLRIRRNGQELERTLVMSKYPLKDREKAEVIATNRPAPWRGAEIDFTSVLGDGEDTRTTLSIMGRGGVGVVSVRPGSVAEAAGLEKGSIIAAVNGQRVDTPGQFRALMKELENKPVELTLAGASAFDQGRKITVPPK